MTVTTDPSRFDVPEPRDLRAMRIIAQLTIREAADRVGVDRDTLRRWEQGDSSPRLCDVQALLEEYKSELNGQHQFSTASRADVP